MNNNSQHRKLRAAAQSSELSATITAVSTAVGSIGDFVLQELGNAGPLWIVTGSVVPL